MEYIVKDSWLTDVADAIREKKGSTDPILSDNFASEIESIESGGGESGENKLAKVLDGTVTEITASDLEGATKIRDYAFFSCISLMSVDIPNSVTSIGKYAFSDCDSLTSIEIPNSVTSIGNYAFNNCSKLESVTIGNGVTSIGDRAFYICYDLESVTIGSGITSIGDRAFYSCNLKSVTIEAETAPTLSNVSAFTGISTTCVFTVKNLDSYNSTNWVAIRDKYTFVEKVEYSEGLAYTGHTSGFATVQNYTVSGVGTCTDTDIIIPDTYEGVPVTGIDSSAFQDCANITSVTVPNSVTSIAASAFRRSSITSVTIPNSVTTISQNSFEGCANLTSVTIPNSVTYLGDNSFQDCSSLTSVTIGNGLTSMGSMMFYRCTNLATVTFAENSKLSSLGTAAFASTGLTSIEIPNSVTSIGNEAFYGCTGLTSIEIPDRVTSIGNYAFEDCTNLTSVTINAETAPTLSSKNAFNKVPTTCIFTVENLDSYNSTNWVAIRDKYTFVEKE